MKTYKRLITSSHGVVPTLRRELKYLRYTPFWQYNTGLYLEAPREKVAHLNLWLRTASKVWLILTEKERVTTFEALFQQVQTIDRSQYIAQWTPITIKALTHKSDLSSTRTVQSIVHKAILTNLTWDDKAKRTVDETKDATQIRITISNNTTSIAINTSWAALHQRWWREETGEAPLKEHIAAALVLMTSRSYESPLIDPYCGSWTILIEAAMLASNRAPGQQRSFAFEQFPCFASNNPLEQEKKDALQRTYDKPYILIGYDNDNEILKTARDNAKRAWVEQFITFEHANSTRLTFTDTQTIITNPPYGNRIGQDIADTVHYALLQQAPNTKNMTVISWYEWIERLLQEHWSSWKQIECNNGADLCKVLIKN